MSNKNKIFKIKNAINHVTNDKTKIYGFINTIFAFGFSYLLAVLLYYVLNSYRDYGSIEAEEVFKRFNDLDWYLILAYFAVSILISLFIELFAYRPFMRPIRRAIAKKNGDHFKYGMTYIYDGDQCRFSSSDTFGWGGGKTDLEYINYISMILIGFPFLILIPIEHKIQYLRSRQYFTKIFFFLAVQLRLAIFPKNADLLMFKACEKMILVQESDINYGKSRYYLALMTEKIGRNRFNAQVDQDMLTRTQELLIEAIDLGVENAEFQLGMFYLQYASTLADRSVNGNKEGVRLLQNVISKPSSNLGTCNMCRIAIAKSLSDSEDADELEYAIKILDDFDIGNKETAKLERSGLFVRDCLKDRREKNDAAFIKEAFRLTMINPMKHDSIPLDKRMINADYTSLNDIKTKLNLKLANAREIELIKTLEAEKRKATENLMAMFSHKFRGPVDSIIFNTQHKHDERIYLDAARTMTGLLEVFSIVSTEPENLAEAMRNDLGGSGSPEKTILRSLKLALMQLLSQRNIKRMSRHYWRHARRGGLVPENVSFKDWATQSETTVLEKEIQEKLEMAVSALSIENGAVELLAWLQSNLFATTIEVADDSQIRFAEYGRKEALLITIMTEVLVNAIKHTDVTSSQPLSISWKEEDQALVFECTNPSSRESRSGVSRGSGKGHLFLKTLLDKMQGEFKPDVYRDLSSVHITMPYDLLKGAAK
ncbi:MAG: hypothetical protein PHV02_00160 [Rhodocyclaceae bacterium]|nr:hypothetical protein [Rhodocyclaceae bacterium]